ncbi:MAG: hypothetical protein KC912_23270 [Proteobacteria bacterium]|nr:hypothetical protein [Pseudomonadota bacterium]
MTRLSPVLLLLAAGCAPNNAELTGGKYLAFFPTDGSPVLLEGKISLPEEGAWTEANCSPNVGETNNSAQCEVLEAESSVERPHEPWTDDDSFSIVKSTIEPWRGEGIITSEGDLQVLFHHSLTGGEDFRFLFVLDPDFQPRRCVQTEGGSAWEDVDGNWLENWSDGVDGTRYYLNAGATQLDPNPTIWKPFEFEWNEWFLPDTWRAGYAVGRYGASRLAIRRTQYEYPWMRAEMAQDWAGVTTAAEQDKINDTSQVLFYNNDCADVEAVATGIATDVAALAAGVPGGVDDMNLTPIVECNEWREQDEIEAGIDGWREINYSWVDINPGADMTKGGSVSGTFHLTLDGTLSQTVFIVEGDFVVENLKGEAWSTPDLNQELLEENEVELCSGTPASSARMTPKVGFQILERAFDEGR